LPQALAALLLSYVALLHLTIHVPRMAPLGHALPHLKQGWTVMTAPNEYDANLVLDARLADGSYQRLAQSGPSWLRRDQGLVVWAPNSGRDVRYAVELLLQTNHKESNLIPAWAN